MQSSPAVSQLQTIAPPASATGSPVSGKSGKLQPISAEEWKSLSSNQRQTRFKAHYDAVQHSWKGIEAFLEKSVDQAAQALNAEPADTSLKTLTEGRKKALQQLKAYLFDRAHPKMLDPLYLNQTREHLEEIHTHLGNQNLDSDIKLGAVMELARGLGVCKEGIALNILACAKTLNARNQPHPLHGLYKTARDELINQHLLTAVRLSHATPVYSGKLTGQPTGYRESERPQHRALEIHEVQALRNALSGELGLQYIPDKYINPHYEKAIGAIAKSRIPQLITTHAVASRVADEVMNWMRGTGLLSEQVIQVDGTSAPRQVMDISGDQYKDLCTSLQNELGLEPALLFDTPDDDFTRLALVSSETLTDRLVDWIQTVQDKPGSSAKGLGEASHGAVSNHEIREAMRSFLEPKRNSDNSHISKTALRAALPDPVRNPFLPHLRFEGEDDKKRKEQEQASKPSTQYL